jgi:hypothetical protein
MRCDDGPRVSASVHDCLLVPFRFLLHIFLLPGYRERCRRNWQHYLSSIPPSAASPAYDEFILADKGFHGLGNYIVCPVANPPPQQAQFYRNLNSVRIKVEQVK